MNKFYKSHIKLFLTLSIAVLMIGCNFIPSVISDLRMNIQIGQIGRIARHFDTYNGVESRGLDVESDQRISFDYEAVVYKGSLVFKCLDPSGLVVWEMFISESASGTDEFVSESPGRYTLIVDGQRAAGSFNIAWEVE
ncbi:hypothetical protein ACFLUA_02075 [Chloroflexota bacterium]